MITLVDTIKAMKHFSYKGGHKAKPSKCIFKQGDKLSEFIPLAWANHLSNA